MNGKRSGSLLRFGLAAVLACGLVPAAAFSPAGGALLRKRLRFDGLGHILSGKKLSGHGGSVSCEKRQGMTVCKLTNQ